MKILNLVLCFILCQLYVFAQTTGVVKDSQTGKAIPYAAVWLENSSIGVSSEADGTFSIETKPTDRFLISSLGYKDASFSINPKGIYVLEPVVYELNEVVLQPMLQNKKLKVGKAKKTNSSILGSKYSVILAKLFLYKREYTDTPFLKEIEFFTNSPIQNAVFKIRIFDFDTLTQLPGKDILFDDVFVKVKKGKRSTVVDVSDLKILFPKNGLAIAAELLLIEENKYEESYNFRLKTSQKHFYAPKIILNYSEEERSFFLTNQKWYRNKKEVDHIGRHKGKKMVFEPAINIVLTN